MGIFAHFKGSDHINPDRLLERLCCCLSLDEVAAEAKRGSKVVGTMGVDSVVLSVCTLPGQVSSVSRESGTCLGIASRFEVCLLVNEIRSAVVFLVSKLISSCSRNWSSMSLLNVSLVDCFFFF